MDIRDGAPPESPTMGARQFTPARASAVLQVLRQSLPSRYEVQREIGRGGSALVFLAVDRERGENVAIKVLRPELAEAMSAARFLQEVQLARHLEHPGVLPLYDSGALGSLPYFVMPYVEGETLRMRLKRDRELPYPEVLRIARGIADTLDYAHGLGVVHRDIKPANILLAHDRVIVADFGIARAITRATLLGPDSHTIGTPTGVAIGTPEYMCPEQVSADRLLDGRADVYSLGCVVYEMIAGEPPFTGPTPAAIVARHCYEPPRSLRVVRPSISETAQRVVERALAKVPADRYETAGAFVAALDSALAEIREPFITRVWRHHRRAVSVGLMLLLGASAAFLVPRTGREWKRRSLASRIAELALRADTTKYAVLPVRATGALPFDVAELLRAALRRWDGISVLDSATVRASVEQVPNDLAVGTPNLPALIGGAGRYIAAEAESFGDSVRVHATLRDSRTDSALAGGTLQIVRDAPDVGASIARLGERLVFANLVEATDVEPSGTSSVAARLAYLRARSALTRWQLADADSGFRSASRIDPQYGQSLLRLALVRQWAGVPVQQWSFVAEQAQQAANRLTLNERLMADALVFLAHGRRGDACSRWKELTVRAPRTFEAWYGLSNCLANDSLVLRDERTPNQWSFREDGEGAINALDQAIRLQDVVTRTWIQNVRSLLHCDSAWVKIGHTSDGARFLGPLLWQANTYDLPAVPESDFDATAAARARSADDAVLHSRQHFRSIAQMWEMRWPDDPLALEALSEALDLLAVPSAVDSAHRARGLASSPEDRVRLAALETWLRVKYSGPDKLDGLRLARALADSVLRGDSLAVPNAAAALGGLSALTGRAALATRYERIGLTGAVDPSIEPDVSRLLTYAAMGGPPDTLRFYAAAVVRGMSGLTADARARASQWMTRSALLAIPDSSLAPFVPPSSDARTTLFFGWRARDRAAVQHLLADRRVGSRQAIHAFDASIEDLYSEASVLSSLGDHSAAIATLDPALDSLAFFTTEPLPDAARAATLLRAFALRAELAAAVHDMPTARRWARAALLFWSDADEPLRPFVERLRRLSN